MSRKTMRVQIYLVRTFLAGTYGLAFVWPITVFFQHRGGTKFSAALTLQTLPLLLFPLLGLIAFTLVTWQVLIATNLWWLRRVWPPVLHIHRFEGLFALLFALGHPFFILLAYGLGQVVAYKFVAPHQIPYVLLAETALTILIATVATAYLAWRGWRLPWWRRLHRLNYLVFGLLWLHSWLIGSDIQTTGLRWLWLAYLGLVVISIGGKYRRYLDYFKAK